MCLCFGCSGVGGEWVGGLDRGREPWGGVMSMWVWIICVDGRSRYLCIVLGGYLHIWGAPSVKSCCTLWISAFWYVFVYGRYHKSRLSCLKLSDLDWSRHHPLLWAAVPAIQRVRMAGLPKNGKSGPQRWGRESSTQFAQQLESTVTAPPLVGCVVWSLWWNMYIFIGVTVHTSNNHI